MFWIILTVLAAIAATIGIAVLLLGNSDDAKFGGFTVLGVTGLSWLVVTAVASVVVIDPGYEGVTVTLGSVGEETLESGVNLKNPASDVHHYYTKRQLIDMRNSDVATSEGVRAITSDKTSIWLDVAFPYRLNGEYANWIHENIGGINKYKTELLIPAAREAVKNAADRYTWDQVAISEKDAVVGKIRQDFTQAVHSDLVSSGLSKDEAQAVFTFNPVQLRNVKLPEKLQNSINERQASKEELKRQQTLTQIAEEEANRRRNVGSGIAMMFEELPDGYNADEMSKILSSIAEVRRAKAVTTAIERDQITWGLFTGGQGVNPGVNAK